MRYPDLPEPFDPEPEAWLAVLRTEVDAMHGERVVLCHSLGCLLWMLFARECSSAAAQRVLLVAPPCDWSIPAIARFRPHDVDQGVLDRACPQTLMLWSDPDPYCPGGAFDTYGALSPAAIEIPDGGHLNTDAGYGPWPEAERWALGDAYSSL